MCCGYSLKTVRMHFFPVSIRICQPSKVVSTTPSPQWTSLFSGWQNPDANLKRMHQLEAPQDTSTEYQWHRFKKISKKQQTNPWQYEYMYLSSLQLWRKHVEDNFLKFLHVFFWGTLLACQKGLDKKDRPRSDCFWRSSKKGRPRSDCFWRSSLIRVFPICYSDKKFVNSSSETVTNILFENRKKKMFKILKHLPYTLKGFKGTSKEEPLHFVWQKYKNASFWILFLC